MKPVIKALVIATALTGSSAWACGEITQCVSQASAAFKHTYYFLEGDLKGKIASTPEIDFSSKDAEMLFTHGLHQLGYSRVPTAPGVYSIQRARDARDTALPSFRASKAATPDLPNTFDLIQLNYKATNKGAVEMMARGLRAFMPANARIVPFTDSGNLVLTLAAKEVAGVLPLIRDLDVPGVKPIPIPPYRPRKGKTQDDTDEE